MIGDMHRCTIYRDATARQTGLTAAELLLACGQSEAAFESAVRIAEMAVRDIGDALTGYARRVEGLVAAAAADPEASHALRTAVRLFGAARLPLEQVRAQNALAEAVAASDPAVAVSLTGCPTRRSLSGCSSAGGPSPTTSATCSRSWK